MVALQNDIEMSFVKSLCDTFKYDSKICGECPWLKGNYKNYDEELESLYMEMAPDRPIECTFCPRMLERFMHAFFEDLSTLKTNELYIMSK